MCGFSTLLLPLFCHAPSSLHVHAEMAKAAAEQVKAMSPEQLAAMSEQMGMPAGMKVSRHFGVGLCGQGEG